jgi:MOSC domain-containing protein YiiM
MKSATGKLIGIYVGAQQGAGKMAVASAELVAGHGLRGDCHAGVDPDRQVSLFEGEMLRELEVEGINVSAEGISANLLTEGVALNSLGAGARLRVGEAVIEIVEARKPCGNLTKLDRRLPKRLYQRCGMLGRIIRGGVVRGGEEVEVLTEE